MNNTAVPKKLLCVGNKKIPYAYFPLPPGQTCPGATHLCRSVCYGRKRLYRDVILGRERRYTASLSPDFVPRIIREVKSNRYPVVRPHTTGDYYSRDYLKKWLDIANTCNDTYFYSYTRSFNILQEFPNIPQNFRLIGSLDASSEPETVRLAIALLQNGILAGLSWIDNGEQIPELPVRHNTICNMSCYDCDYCLTADNFLVVFPLH